jgi:hypothetical protein
MLGIENVTELLLNTEMTKYFNFSIKRSACLFLCTRSVYMLYCCLSVYKMSEIEK